MQKVKERGSCPMRDNKNRPHRPLWRSCSPLPKPHGPPSTLDHFHTPDAMAMMTVDHKLLTKSSQVMWKSRWQFYSCVTKPGAPSYRYQSSSHTHTRTDAGIHIKHTCFTSLQSSLPRRYPTKSSANISIKENVRTV